MLILLGTIAGNILSLPGILGVAVGMMTRSIAIGAVLGGCVGLLEVAAFAQFGDGLEVVISVLVGVVAGCIGTFIRRKGATV